VAKDGVQVVAWVVLAAVDNKRRKAITAWDVALWSIHRWWGRPVRLHHPRLIMATMSLLKAAVEVAGREAQKMETTISCLPAHQMSEIPPNGTITTGTRALLPTAHIRIVRANKV